MMDNFDIQGIEGLSNIPGHHFIHRYALLAGFSGFISNEILVLTLRNMELVNTGLGLVSEFQIRKMKPAGSLGLSSSVLLCLFLKNLDFLMQIHDFNILFLTTREQLVFGVDKVLNKLFKIDVTIMVLITLSE